MRRGKGGFAAVAVSLSLLLGACSDADMSPVERGRRVYVANCIACHAIDPAADGVMGPAIAGSSLALLEARVLRGEYPDGYRPKRDTRLMVALPYLAGDLPALDAYLRSVDGASDGGSAPGGTNPPGTDPGN